MSRLFLWSITSALAGFLFGFDTVVISGAEQKIQSLWGLSPGLHGVAMGAALYGTVLGSLLGGWPTDRLGRRATLLWIGVLYVVSALGCAFATGVGSFIASRFVGGLGIGISRVAAPLYISEIAPPRHRGRLAGMFQFNIVFGILVAFASNAALAGVGESAWRADITSESTVDLVKEALGGDADVVICDAAPNLTGAWHRDHAVSVDLARSALKMAKKLLRPRGNFVVKVFQGDLFPDFLNEVRKEFSSVQAHSPQAYRKESAETSIVAKKLLTSPVRKGDILDVQIESVGKSGDGVAIVEGFAIIVRKAQQGEKLRVKVDAVKPNFAFADILERKD